MRHREDRPDVPPSGRMETEEMSEVDADQIITDLTKHLYRRTTEVDRQLRTLHERRGKDRVDGGG